MVGYSRRILPLMVGYSRPSSIISSRVVALSGISAIVGTKNLRFEDVAGETIDDSFSSSTYPFYFLLKKFALVLEVLAILVYLHWLRVLAFQYGDIKKETSRCEVQP